MTFAMTLLNVVLTVAALAVLSMLAVAAGIGGQLAEAATTVCGMVLTGGLLWIATTGLAAKKRRP